MTSSSFLWAESPTDQSNAPLPPAERLERTKEEFQRRISKLERSERKSAIGKLLKVPSLYRGRLLKALVGEASPKQAIAAQCHQCVGWEDVKTRVGECKSSLCALWCHRPHQKGSKDGEE